MAHASPPEQGLVEKYSEFAGSRSNAHALVTGLRYDRRVRLDDRVSFTPPTSEMGWGNVDISLELAKATLAGHGIHDPTPEQIKAALVGGTVTVKPGEIVTFPGVLNLRADGMGWGQIAQKHGSKLGDVMGGHGRSKPDVAGPKHHGRPDFARASAERPDFARPHRVERPHRPERPERPHRGR